MADSNSTPAKVIKLRTPRTAAPAPAAAADAVETLRVHAESAIALLQLLIQQLPTGYPANDPVVIKGCAFADAAIKALKTASDANSAGPYLAAGAEVRELLLQIEDGMGIGQTDEGAATCFGLTWAIESFLQVNGFLAAKPDALIATLQPAPEVAAGSSSADALSEAVNDVACELSYARELSDALHEAAEVDNPNRIEALATAIGLFIDSVSVKLDKHVDAAKGASHG